MELYRNEIGVVVGILPVGSSNITCNIYKNGALVAGPLGPTVTINSTNVSASIELPFTYVTKDDEIDVKFNFSVNFTTSSVTEHVSIVTPIISREAAELIATGKFAQYEPIVRHIIQSYTGQRFGLWEATYPVYGESGGQLLLPDRLISQSGVSYDGTAYDPTGFIIKGGGWYLARKTNVPLSIKEAPPEDDLINFTGVIYSPNYYRSFGENTVYSIAGIWGYEYVPQNVQEAAKMLFNDYVCNDAIYRDRYLKSIRSADWRLEFNSGAWAGTGNVKADQLLSDYKRSGMMVI